MTMTNAALMARAHKARAEQLRGKGGDAHKTIT